MSAYSSVSRNWHTRIERRKGSTCNERNDAALESRHSHLVGARLRRKRDRDRRRPCPSRQLLQPRLHHPSLTCTRVPDQQERCAGLDQSIEQSSVANGVGRWHEHAAVAIGDVQWW
eukprot:6950851-Prymnesium_polylepis.1